MKRPKINDEFEALVPSLSSEQYERLRDDVLACGEIRVPLVVDELGQVLDGHHRERIRRSTRRKIRAPAPIVVGNLESQAEKKAYVIASALNRRQLSREQRAELRRRQIEIARELKATGLTQSELGRRLAVARETVRNWLTSNGQKANACIDSRITIPRREHARILERHEKGESQQRIADDYEVTQQRIAQILEQERARGRKDEDLEPDPIPRKRYRAIVIDPPWPMKKIEREKRPKQGAKLDYRVMSLDEIAALPVRDLAYKSGCHVYLWVTQRFLPCGFQLFERWGVRYQCLMTWVKNVGITPFSWMYDTEHVLFGRIGSLDLERKGLRLSFSAKVCGHSVKPDVFYERVREASPEPRADWFGREEKEGFDTIGNEAARR